MNPDESGVSCAREAVGMASEAIAARASANAPRRTAERDVRRLMAPLAGRMRPPRPFESPLAIRLQHVLEPHPLLVEEEIHVATRTVAVLEDEELRRAIDVRCGVVHLVTIQPE